MAVSGDALRRLIAEGAVKDFRDLKAQLQPASVDLTVSRVFRFVSAGAIDFDNSERKMADVEEIRFDEKGWALLPQGAYKIRFAEAVRIPSDYCAVTFARSSLARCGCDLYNGWWDPGYEGRGESVFVVHNEHGLRLKKGARVAQLVFFRLNEEAKELYGGIHHKENLEGGTK
ncbi:deoxyuridine 5'-triphosphate nucleotidohydrolase [Candidatus Micrarchaeota archaeon CG08_land_8_20_14_0_20_59_11]|nr:MAG: deoxyuridine 5'-triphosphate nucleotidohydrolase [Candidatus Micrarchaeota archaeon CG08_land_8_20_14_0_20_59_11]